MPSTVRREAAVELSLLLSTSRPRVVPRTTWTGSSRRTPVGMFQMRKLRPEGFRGKPWSPVSHFPNRRSIQSGESIPQSGRTGNQAAV